MVYNPYEGGAGQWIRGNFHGHCAEHSSCASVPLHEAIERCSELGLHFTAITDHDCVTDLTEVRSRNPTLIVLAGFEHSRAANLLVVGETVPPLYKSTLSDAIVHSNGNLTIACHPEPRPGDSHWSRRKLRRLAELPDGIEIYNGHYGVPDMVARGCNPRYTGFWDRLLTDGTRVWGFANDDSHDAADFGNAFNMVNVNELRPEAIIKSAKAGRFYASTGLVARSIEGKGRRIEIDFSTVCTGRFIGPGGKIFAESKGGNFAYELRDEEYIRFEAEAFEGEIFLQPVFQCS